jgi:hypothetical protein
MVDIHVQTARGELEVRVSGVSTTRCVGACDESYLSGPISNERTGAK